jgi:hypothetical protein
MFKEVNKRQVSTHRLPTIEITKSRWLLLEHPHKDLGRKHYPRESLSIHLERLPTCKYQAKVDN